MADHIIKPPAYTCPVCGLVVDTPGWKCTHDETGAKMSEPDQNIEQLDGPALAAAVAEKVMGWTLKDGQCWYRPDGSWTYRNYGARNIWAFRPDVSIAQAWLVKGRMIELGWEFVYTESPVGGGPPHAWFTRDGAVRYEVHASGATAICLASFKAVGAG